MDRIPLSASVMPSVLDIAAAYQDAARWASDFERARYMAIIAALLDLEAADRKAAA